MEKVISFLQGVATITLLVAVAVGYWAVGEAAATVQSCPHCHGDMRGSDIVSYSGGCGAPTCNSMAQFCCLEEIIVN